MRVLACGEPLTVPLSVDGTRLNISCRKGRTFQKLAGVSPSRGRSGAQRAGSGQEAGCPGQASGPSERLTASEYNARLESFKTLVLFGLFLFFFFSVVVFKMWVLWFPEQKDLCNDTESSLHIKSSYEMTK